jgi:replicative DNA helicase
VEKSVGLKLISSLLSTGDVETFSKVDINPVILKPHELECYDYIRQFIYKHKKIPLSETMLQELGDITLPIAKEVPSYYANQIKERFISDAIKKGFTDTKQHLTKENMNVDEGINVLTDTLMSIHKATNQTHIVDFKDSKDFIAKAYKQKKIQGMEGTVLMGYPTVDKMSGGMVGGDLVSIVGRPAMGKTWSTLYMAHNAWYQQHKTVLYVPLEMTVLAIEQRLASMHTKHSLTQLKKAQLSTKDHKNLLVQLDDLSDFEKSFWIAGGDITSTVEDIWKVAMQCNPDFILVDGAYLLSHPNPRMGKYERVGENARALKQMLAMDFNIPVVASWQFNRNASKKMEKSKDAKPGLEDIGYTDEIGQLSSVVLGLMQEESIETILTREVEIMKGRDGEVGTFHTRWDFYNMDFSELLSYEEQQEDMEDTPVIVN